MHMQRTKSDRCMYFKLGDFSDINTGYSLRPSTSDGDIKIIQPKNIDDFGNISFGNLQKADVPRLKDQSLESGDVLLVSRGRPLALVFTNKPSNKIVASSSFLRIRLNNNSVVTPEYLVQYLNSTAGRTALSKHQTHSSTIPMITKTELMDLEIPIPSIENQKKLTALGQGFDRFRIFHGIQLKLYETMVNNTMNKITGENDG